MEDKLYFNGINGDKGTYGLPPMTPQALSDQIQASSLAEARRLKEGIYVEEETWSELVDVGRSLGVDILST